MNNGGVSQFFFNSSGNFANKLAQAYKEIGAPKTAEICNTAVNAFKQKLPTDMEEREQCFTN